MRRRWLYVVSSTVMELIVGDAHIHEYCFNAYKRHRGPKCPKCEISFDDTEPSFLGEKAATREADHFRAAPGRKRKRPSAAEVEEEETDGEMEDEEGMRTQSQSQSQEQSQSQSQQAGPPAARKGVGTSGYQFCGRTDYSLHGTLTRVRAVEERSYQKRNTRKMNSSHQNHHDRDDVEIEANVPTQPETEHSQNHACRNVVMKQEEIQYVSYEMLTLETGNP